VIVTDPTLVSVYVVKQVSDVRVQTVWLKLPVLLFVLQVIVPVGSEPETLALQITANPAGTGFGEHTIDVEDWEARNIWTVRSPALSG
jgi:hypothetical protein